MFGLNLSLPFGISPTVRQNQAYVNGEVGIALTAKSTGIPFRLALAAESSIEQMALAAPNTHLWFQMFIMADLELTKQLVQRAEAAGYKAIVLTIDMRRLGLRRTDIRNGLTFPVHSSFSNFGDYVKKIAKQKGIHERDVEIPFKANPSWEDIKWLKSFMRIPLILKGILTPEDALMAVESGADGIIVSNHGGRHLDSTLPSVSFY